MAKDRIELGTGADGGPVWLDLDVLLRSRMLIQGSSGSGKSWFIRRIAEQAFGKVPIIIIDPEGEQESLRTEFAFVLASRSERAEASIEPRIAGALAQKLLELRASAICDIFDLRVDERHAWVKGFLEGLISVPKRLWGPCLVIVDEIHKVAPERGMGESIAEAAVTDVATLGRKRGIALIGATQRLGKLSKTVAAELGNVFIGQTQLDVDLDRAERIMGVSPRKAEKEAFRNKLRSAQRGSFYCYGPAVAKEPMLVRIGGVSTPHPEPGSFQHGLASPPAPRKIAHLLPSLADLPKEAEKKLRTEADLRKRIAELEGEQRKAQKAAPAPPAERVEVPVLQPDERAAIDAIKAEISEATASFQTATAALEKSQGEVARIAAAVSARVSKGHPPLAPSHPSPPRPASPPRRAFVSLPGSTPALGGVQQGSDAESLGPMERAFLTVLAQHPDGMSKGRILLLADYRSSGPASKAFARLTRERWAEGDGSRLRITEAGVATLGAFDPLPRGAALRALLIERAKGPMEAAFLQQIFAVYPDAAGKGHILGLTGYASSGPASKAFARITKAGWVTAHGRGFLRAADDLFEE